MVSYLGCKDWEGLLEILAEMLIKWERQMWKPERRTYGKNVESIEEKVLESTKENS